MSAASDREIVLTSSHNMPVRLRPFSEGDLTCVISDWLRSFRDAPDVASTQNDIYYAGMKVRIGRIAEIGKIIIACNPGSPREIYGWMAYRYDDESLIIDYCYVKYKYRRLGVARTMFDKVGGRPDQITRVSHWTERCEILAKKIDLVKDASCIPLNQERYNHGKAQS